MKDSRLTFDAGILSLYYAGDQRVKDYFDDVSLQEAKKMILIYLKKNLGSHFASEIADELGMDYRVAFGAVN